MIPLSAVVPWGDVEIVHRRPGPWAMSWGIALRARQRPSIIRRGAWVEAYAGGRLCWSGVCDEPDWNSGQFSAVGIARLGEGAQCLNGAGAVTSKPNTALDQASGRGVVPWIRGGNDFGSGDLAGPEGGTGVADPDPGSLNDLLNAWSVWASGLASQMVQWFVTPEGLVGGRWEDETTADWIVLPGADELGVADENVTDRVFLRYLDSTAGVNRTASYPSITPPGGIERRASIVHLGPMSAADATNRAEGMWRRAGEGRTGWTNGLLLRTGQVVTPGGQWANFSLMAAGQAFRVMGQRDPRGVTADINVLADETTWRPKRGAHELQMNPIGLAARTWEQVMEDAMATDAA
jgi:hypothetical protein